MPELPLWTLRFEAMEWATDPIVSSPAWEKPLWLWLTSTGDICAASSCCGAQQSPRPASLLFPARLICIKCNSVRLQGSLLPLTDVNVRDQAKLRASLYRWASDLGPPKPNGIIAEELAPVLLDLWETKFALCYSTEDETEEQAWRTLARVSDSVRMKSDTLVRND